MARRFESVACPETPVAVKAPIEEAFTERTGHPMTHQDSIYVERHRHGGMSSGHVCPKFWSDIAVPLLLARHAESP
jgi:hypothetical protein